MSNTSLNKRESSSSMTLVRPKAIIFDWDNTLVNTWPVIHEALNATLAAMGHPLWTLDQTRERVRKSMRDAFPELFGADWEKAGEIYQQHYREHSPTHLEPLPQALDVLKRIDAMGIYTVVVSNKKGPVLRREIEHMKWGGYFKTIIGADDAVRDKPHADPVHMALDKSGITPAEDVWFIGDSDVDLECAEVTGCTAILYGDSAHVHPAYTNTHFHGFPYHAHVHNHAQLLKLLSEYASFIRGDGVAESR